MIEKLIRDFMTIWTTIDPIGNLALFAGLTAAMHRSEQDRGASIALRRDQPGRCGRNWPNSARCNGNSSTLIADRRRPYPVRFWFADGLRLDRTAASKFQTLFVFTANRVFSE